MDEIAIGQKEIDEDHGKSDYVLMREGFIDTAEKIANKHHGKTHGKKNSEKWAAEWNHTFHFFMEKMIKEFLAACSNEWIVGAESCRAYLNKGSWKVTKAWIKRYKAPLRYWPDGRPVFIKSEIDEFLKNKSPIEKK